MSTSRAKTLGTAVAATGVLHLAFGVVSFREPLTAMVKSGILASLDGAADRQATLWYFVAGGFLISAGLTIRWAVKLAGRVPGPMAWGLLIIAMLGVIVAPVSGFWLVLIEGALLVLTTRSSKRLEVLGVTSR